MEYTIKIKLKTGKEIELTKEELEELIKNHSIQVPVYPLTAPYISQPVNPWPYNDRWYYSKPIEVTCTSKSGYAHRVDS